MLIIDILKHEQPRVLEILNKKYCIITISYEITEDKTEKKKIKRKVSTDIEEDDSYEFKNYKKLMEERRAVHL